MTKLQERAHIITIMGQNMKANGLTINNMDMESKFGSMEANMKGITIWAEKVAKASTHGKMAVTMMETG